MPLRSRPTAFRTYVQWRVDARSLAYSITLAILTALVFGLVPALQTTSRALQETLKEGARGSTGSRALVRNALVVTQVSLALVALVGAMLFVRSFQNIDGRELGFETRALMTMRFHMGGDAYEPENSRLRRVEEVVRRIEALPRVQSAFASNLVPIDGGGDGGEIEVEGRTNERGRRQSISFIGVTPGFHETLGVRVRRGRDFGEAESWSTRPVAIINEAMARRIWPQQDPIGRRFRLWSEDGSRPWLTVIGVAPDLRLFGIDPENSQADPTAFAPYGYSQAANTGLTIRVAGEPASIATAARAAIRASDRNLPISWMRTMDDVRRLAYGIRGCTDGSSGPSASSACCWLRWASMECSRTRSRNARRRLACAWRWARARGHVLKLVLGQGLGLAAVGVGVGLVLAALGTPLARSLLYDVSPFDPLSFVAVSAFLVGVALLASYVPARRATKVDPVVALRQD